MGRTVDTVMVACEWAVHGSTRVRATREVRLERTCCGSPAGLVNTCASCAITLGAIGSQSANPSLCLQCGRSAPIRIAGSRAVGEG